MNSHESVKGYCLEGRYNPDFKFKRFIVFFAEQYYPSGGLDDAVATFDTLEETRSYLDAEGYSHDMTAFDCDERREISVPPA